jgi:hypothetical protein
MLNFLTSNKIYDLSGFDKKLQSMIGERFRINDELKSIDRRLKDLDKHIAQTELIKEHSKIHKIYKGLKPKEQPAFYESKRAALTMYEAAERYIKGVLIGRDKIPLPTWKAEREKLTAEKMRLNREYTELKTETAKVEKIRSNVYDIISAERHREQPQRAKGMER